VLLLMSTTAAAAPLENMRTDRHLVQVQVLAEQRRAAGKRARVRCMLMLSGAGGGGAGGGGAGSGGAGGGSSKVVHFVRHGQAVHNALAAAEGAVPCRCKRGEPMGLDTPRDDCPYNSEQAFDARLTEVGRSQAAALRPTTATTGTELVVSSPLRRAIETALLAFGERAGGGHGGVLVLESLREQHGMHRCDQRGHTAAIQELFGDSVRGLDELTPDDTLCTCFAQRPLGSSCVHRDLRAPAADGGHDGLLLAGTSQREPKSGVGERCDEFLRWLRGVPQSCVGCVKRQCY
jgi:hypothetical protein